MSATTQLTDFNDLFTDLSNRVRIQTGITATQNQSQRYINIALHDLVVGFAEKLPWLEKRSEILTHAPYSTGTVSVALATRTTVTGVDTLWNTAVTGMGFNNARTTGKMTLSGGTDIFRVTAIASDTSLTITPRFVGDTALSGASYVYFEDEYALASDFLRPIDFTLYIDNFQVPIVSRKEFVRAYPRPNVSGRPRVACIIDLPPSGDTVPIRRLQVYPYPNAVYVMNYRYISSNLVIGSDGTEKAQFTANADEPKLPLRYRHALVFHALSHWYRDKKDDARSQEAKAEYTDLMLRLVGDNEIGTANVVQIQPRPGLYTRKANRPYSGGGRFSINDSFDRFQS